MSAILRPPFPSVIDSSLVAAFRSCPRKAFLEYFHHWKYQGQSVHLHAGGAYAHGLEAARKAFFEQGLPAEDCIAIGVRACLEFYGDFECPEDSAKSATRTAGAIEFYFSRYPLGVDKATPLVLPSGKRAIEFNGVEVLDADHPVTGEPLQYSWRLDMAVGYNGLLLGEDDKTTSSLGASWPRQWDLRSQFTSYIWGAHRNGVPLQGFLVRGVSILKTKYDTLEAITYRPDWQIERWYAQLLRDIARMKECWTEGYFDYNLDHACTEYGGCMFRNVCLSAVPQPILEQSFERRIWNPVMRTEKLVEDHSAYPEVTA